MKTIPPGGSFVNGGAIVPTKVELAVMVHALKVARADVTRGGGKHYGPVMTLAEMDELIAQLEGYRAQRGA